MGGRDRTDRTTAANERYQTYSLHWNGSAWAIVPMPLLTGTDHLLQYQFNSIDAISPTNVWAVGDSGDNVGEGGTPTATVIEHYNGTSWSVVPSPSPGTAPTMTGVSASSAGNVWAVGYDTPAGATTPQTLTLNWNGSAWSTVSSPDVGSSSALGSVSALPGGGVQAVGHSGVAVLQPAGPRERLTGRPGLSISSVRAPRGEPGFQCADDLADFVGAHLPPDGGAALAGERGAVVGAVVDEHGVGEAHAVPGQPRPEERVGVVAFQRSGLAGADDVVADDGPVGQGLPVAARRRLRRRARSKARAKQSMLSVAITTMASARITRSTSNSSALTCIRAQSRSRRRARKSSRNRRSELDAHLGDDLVGGQQALHPLIGDVAVAGEDSGHARFELCVQGVGGAARMDTQNGSRDSTPCQSEKMTRPDSGTCLIKLPGGAGAPPAGGRCAAGRDR